jgi:hypothetical protein
MREKAEKAGETYEFGRELPVPPMDVPTQREVALGYAEKGSLAWRSVPRGENR